MMSKEEFSRLTEIAERKKKLMTEGELYRSRITASRQMIRHSLDVQSLSKIALSHFAGIAYARLEDIVSLKGISVSLSTLIPVVLQGISFLSKRSFLKRGSLLIGGLLVFAYQVVKKRKEMHSNTDQDGR
jgi:hypothetical protein